MTRRENKEIKEGFRAVAPVAKYCELTDRQIFLILRFFQKLRRAGVRGSDAGLALRKQLLELNKTDEETDEADS